MIGQGALRVAKIELITSSDKDKKQQEPKFPRSFTLTRGANRGKTDTTDNNVKVTNVV